MLMLGRDVTTPWTNWKTHPMLEDTRANGMFSTSDVNGEEVFVTHMFSDRDLAEHIAIGLKKPLY